jgi:hypothetical protein
MSTFLSLGCPEVETKCNGNWWTANWSYLFMHGKALTAPGTKWWSYLAIFFIVCITWSSCQVCKKYTRAYLHCLVTKDAMGSQLLSYHNLSFMMRVY